MSVDARGILRGQCQACSCSGYSAGDKGLKCVDCGHPSGRHINLSISAMTQPPPQPQIVPPTNSLWAQPQSSAHTAPGPPAVHPQCQFLECARALGSKSAPLSLPFSSPRKKLRTVQSLQAPSLPLQSRPSPCSLASSGAGTCSLPGCTRSAYVDPANNRTHYFCGRTHAFLAQEQGIPVDSVGIRVVAAGSQEFKIISGKFQKAWAKGSCPPVSFIFIINNRQLQQRWSAYQQELSIQTVEEHYHGTVLKCNITTSNTLCNDSDCGICGISRTGFDRRCIHKSMNFQRFGYGIYVAPNSSKCHDYTRGAYGYRAMLLCDLCPGRKYVKTNTYEKLQWPPLGYDSVHGQAGSTSVLNYDEAVIYNPDAILPRYIILYQKETESDATKKKLEGDFQLENLLEKYRHQGMIKHKSLKCLFTGPPRTGKTTLKKRLLKAIKNLISLGIASPSGGFENPISIVIGETRERVTAFMESDVDWQTQHDLLDEAQTVLGFIDQQPISNVVPTSQQLGSPTSTPDPFTLNPPTSDRPTLGLDLPHSNQPPAVEADTLDDVQQLMQEVLEKRGLRTIEDIEKTTTLYLIDTGGQPEFHEIMPIILNGPAFHMIFFNLAFNFNDPVIIQFCQQDGTNAMITYETSYTGKQMIYQLLSSLYCFSMFVSTHSKPTAVQASLPYCKSAAVLIGTHLDKLKNQGEKELEEINDSLKQLFSNAEFHTQGFLTYPKKGGRVFIPVNNHSGDEEEIEQLQRFLRQITDDRFGSVLLPSSWLFFHLLLRHRYENSPGVCTLAECRALARGCGLDEDDVPQVLRYIHQHLGTILFYEQVEGLNELVICDPNVLFKSIYHLVAVSFAGEKAYHTSADKVRKTGEIPISELQEHIDAQPSSSLLTNDHVFNLLKHFKILTELRDGMFFMPCLLQPNHSLKLTTEQLLGLRVPPLLVCFDGNYIPVGVFSALVVKLTQSSWEPDPEYRYRNYISFLNKDGLSSVELIVFPAYFEFRIPIDNHTEEEPEEIHQFCMEVHKTVVDTLKAVLDLHEHTRNVGFQLGFYCPGSFQPDGQPHFGRCLLSRIDSNPRNIICSKSPHCQSQCRLPRDCTIWFDYWDEKKHSTTTRCQNGEMLNPVDTTSRIASGKFECSLPQNFEGENVDEAPLDEDDLLDVTNYLQYMEKTHIYNLGLVLGLRRIKVKNMKDTSDTFLDDVIAAWLQKQDKVTEKGEPSWTVLINALKHPRVGQTGIANKIAKDKEHITSPVATSLCRGNAEDKEIARDGGCAHEIVDNTSRTTTRGKLDYSQPQNMKWENVDDTPLDECSLRTVLDTISTIASDWFNLGVALGLSSGTLKTIESNYPKDARRCLTEMVVAWLQMKENSQPSWQSLASVLSSPSVGRIEIATMIAAEHSRIS